METRIVELEVELEVELVVVVAAAEVSRERHATTCSRSECLRNIPVVSVCLVGLLLSLLLCPGTQSSGSSLATTRRWRVAHCLCRGRARIRSRPVCAGLGTPGRSRAT